MEIDICDVYMNSDKAGVLVRVKGKGYLFAYHEAYLKNEKAKPLSLSLPIRTEPYKSDKLFPFFEGLLSEGWLRKIQAETQKIDERDSFRLLIENGKDLIGAVSIERVEN